MYSDVAKWVALTNQPSGEKVVHRGATASRNFYIVLLVYPWLPFPAVDRTRVTIRLNGFTN